MKKMLKISLILAITYVLSAEYGLYRQEAIAERSEERRVGKECL